MVKCKLVSKEHLKEEGLKPAVLCGLDMMVRRHQWSGWLEISLCLSAHGQGTARREPSRPFYPTIGRMLMEVCRAKEPSLQPCTPRVPALTAAPATQAGCPLLGSTSILVSISELRNPRMPPRTHCGCTSGAIPGKRGSRSRSCRQLLPPPRLNKGQPSSQIPEIETGETYPFSLDHSHRRVLCTAKCAKPASLG